MVVEIRTETFVKNLAFLRNKYQLTYRALGNLIGIPPFIVEYIEKGKMCPDLPVAALVRLCTIFEVTSNDLLETDLSLLPPSSPIKPWFDC